MYDSYERKCPKHPTMVHPCQICAGIGDPNIPENSVIDGVNWQKEGQIVYPNLPPVPERFNPSERLERRFPEHFHREPEPPPPISPLMP